MAYIASRKTQLLNYFLTSIEINHWVGYIKQMKN